MLHLLRHAKSSRNERVEDHERPLSPRGREAARRLAGHLHDTVAPLDLVLCSTAQRTRETFDILLPALPGRPAGAIEPDLYLAEPTRLAERLRRLPEAVGNVLLIGHNPGLHELALALAAPDSPEYPRLAGDKFPTAALASLRIAGTWSSLAPGRHELVGYVTPALLAGEEE